ncbi:Rpr2-domain-containing protein [Atractiella rhizophila]|nr:Rpr2-domain-containing protein [Atractiella rhizophila]
MVKSKGKEKGAADPKNVMNKDVLQRLNFLYQASVLFSSLPTSRSGEESAQEPSLGKNLKSSTRSGRKASATPNRLTKEMKEIAKRGTVRMDPNVKRSICKNCFAILIPGNTSTSQRSSKHHGHEIFITCQQCGFGRRLPAPPLLPLPEERMDRDSLKTVKRNMQKRELQKDVDMQDVRDQDRVPVTAPVDPPQPPNLAPPPRNDAIPSTVLRSLPFEDTGLPIADSSTTTDKPMAQKVRAKGDKRKRRRERANNANAKLGDRKNADLERREKFPMFSERGEKWGHVTFRGEERVKDS